MIRLALLAALTALQAAQAPFWLKHWRFDGMIGSRAAVRAMAGVNVDHLDLARGRVDHPLGEGVCTRSVDYSDLRHRSRGALAKRVGPFWRFPPTIDTPGSVSGWIKCDGYHVAAVAFVNPTLGYLFFEDGLVIRLR